MLKVTEGVTQMKSNTNNAVQTKKKFQTVSSGKDMATGIAAAAKELIMSIPKLSALPNLDGLEDQTGAKLEAVGKIKEDVPNALKFLSSVDKKIEACKTRIEKKITADATKKAVAEMEDYLGQVLGHTDDIYRAVATAAYLETVFAQDIETYANGSAVLANMVSRGLLKYDSAGPVLIGYQRYSAGDKTGMEREDLNEMSKVIARFAAKMIALESAHRQELTKTMESESQISLDEAGAGKNGRCLLPEVPPQRNKAGSPKEYTGGGFLLVEFDGQDVYPVRASGSIESAVERAARMGVRLQRVSLTWAKPPGSDDDFEGAVAWFENERQISRGEAEDFVKLTQAFWWMIHRSIWGFREQQKVEKQKLLLEAKAQASAKEFYGLNGAEGVPVRGKPALLQFNGRWNSDEGPKFYHPFFLATREMEADTEVLVVNEVPSHLQDFLGQFVGKKFPTADLFRGVPGRLGQLLRAIRSQQDTLAAAQKK